MTQSMRHRYIEQPPGYRQPVAPRRELHLGMRALRRPVPGDHEPESLATEGAFAVGWDWEGERSAVVAAAAAVAARAASLLLGRSPGGASSGAAGTWCGW